MFLIYQEPGKDKYTEVQMTKTAKGWYVGKIPKKAVNGKSIRYYFEGRNVAGKTIVTNGEEAKPLILLLMTEEATGSPRRRRSTAAGLIRRTLSMCPRGQTASVTESGGSDSARAAGLDTRRARAWKP